MGAGRAGYRGIGKPASDSLGLARPAQNRLDVRFHGCISRPASFPRRTVRHPALSSQPEVGAGPVDARAVSSFFFSCRFWSAIRWGT